MIENARCCFLYDYWSGTTGSLTDEEFKSAAPGLEIKIIMEFLCSYLFLSLAQILDSLCERLKVSQRRSKVISVELIVSISAADIVDLVSSPRGPIGSPPLYAPVHMHHSAKYQRCHCSWRDTLSHIPHSEELWKASQHFFFFFLLCVTRARGCHYTNSAPLFNKGTDTGG